MNHAVKFRAARLTLVAVATLSGDAIATQVHWPVQTRNVQFENLSTENGLSSEFVHDLVQGPRGYIWVATQAGLNRFDGQDVALYEHHPDDRTSLSHNFVWTVHADAENRLWVGTDRGVDLYDPVADAFIRRPFGGAVAGLRIRRIVQDRAGRFWIGSLGSGLVAVRPGGGQMTHYRHLPGEPGSLPSDNIIDVLEDRNGELWVGTDGGGLARLDQTTDTFTVFRHDPSDPASLSDDHVRSVYEDAQGRLWIGTAQGGLNRFDPAVSGFVQYGHVPGDPDSLGRGQVKSLFEDTRGTLWIGTENGVSEWRPSTDSFATYVRDLSDRKSLIDDRVNTISQDASGVLWIGTSGGVSAWNYLSDTFHQYRRANGFLQSDVVTSIDQTSDGFFWVATYGGGLTQLDLDGSIARHHRHLANDPASLNDDRVMAVHVDPTDTVWVGTRSGGLGRLNDDGTFTRFQFDPDNPDTLSGNAVTRILSSQDGGLWIGVFGGGLNRLTWRDGTPVFERFRHDPADDTTLSSDRVLALHEDRHGVIWIGTENAGLNRFDPAERRFRRFDIEQSDAADAPDPVNGTPWDLAETNDGTMWIGTLGQGLLRWSSADRAAGRTRFDAFGPEVGLPFDVYAVVQGDDGALWLSSNRGLFRFDVRDASVRKFDRSNGLRNHEFNQGARLLSHSGRVMFGGTGGLLEFLPADIPHNAHPPRIELEARSRTDLLARSAGNGVAAVELGYLDPFVTFRFVALDFVSPDKNEYRFRLAGYDGDWTDAEGYRRAIYSSLPAGNYTFEVQASNSDGVWNREGPTMQVRVIPAPWRSRWAYLTYALLAIGAVVAVLRWQEHKRRQEIRRREQLETLVEERTVQLAQRNEKLTELNDRLKEASVTDQLTGLHNRRFVDQFIESEIAAVKRRHVEAGDPMPDGSARDSSRLLFLLMIDLDGFKAINDTFGHHAGDEALREVRNRLIGGCRRSDVVVRWGGDEFLVVGHASSFDGVKALAEKIRLTVAEPAYEVGNGRTGQLSASIGIAAIPFVEARPDLGTWEQIVAVADHGAYLAKLNGRNAWVSIRGTDRTRHDDFVGMKENLSNLVHDGKLMIDSSTDEPIAFSFDETLVRMQVG